MYYVIYFFFPADNHYYSLNLHVEYNLKCLCFAGFAHIKILHAFCCNFSCLRIVVTTIKTVGGVFRGSRCISPRPAPFGRTLTFLRPPAESCIQHVFIFWLKDGFGGISRKGQEMERNSVGLKILRMPSLPHQPVWV